MNEPVPENLILIAGRAEYPLLLARAARTTGVAHLTAIAFKGETSRQIEQVADEVHWLHVGSLGPLLETLKKSEAARAVMAGQIAPKNLFRVRMDGPMRALLKALPMKNAHAIFGAIIDRIEEVGVKLMPASSFMQDFMPKAGLLTKRAPDERELSDIAVGRRVIKGCSEFDIGQTVIVKDGMILAVEAFEGTDRAIRRGGRLGGSGSVVVKVPKVDHDMRFDIPVIGQKTLRSLKKAGAGCLALEEGGAIMLHKEELIRRADLMGLSVTVLPATEQL